MRARLSWSPADLAALLADARECWPRGTNSTWGQDENPPPGFWLIGDHGVYLMHNGVSAEGQKQPVAYAIECNPKKMGFDDWWAAKSATFGADDGTEYFEPEQIVKCAEMGWQFSIEFHGDSLTLVTEIPS